MVMKENVKLRVAF